MNRNSITYITALLAVVTLSSSSIVTPANKSGNFELLILHNNDMHARFEQTSQLSLACTVADREAGKCYGGFPRVAHVVKEARKAAASGEGPPVLYLNAGDTYTGTPWFTIYKWKIAAEFINALEPDAVSLGNHEFDNGIGGVTPFIANLTCPVLAANLILTGTPELAREPNLKKSIIKEVDGVKVGIVGYLTPETKTLAISNDLEYVEEVVALQKEVKQIQEAGVKIIIAVGHSGFTKDIEIAQKVEGIDLVIGGHTNTFLWNGTQPDVEIPDGPYPKYVTQASGKMVPVVQAYAYTKYLGKLLMVFDADGKIRRIDGNPILLDKSIPQDPEILKMIKFYDEKVNALANEVLGNTSLLFNRVTCRTQECTLGNLITDSMIYRYAATYTGTYWTDAPIAIIQRGGIRASLAHGNITKGDLLTVLPFDGHLNIITINGSVLLKALEHSVANYRLIDPPGAFLHYSGVKVIYDLNKPPGSRVVKAEVRCSECEIPSYSKLQKGQSYKVIVPEFVSKGGDGFAMFKNQPSHSLNYNEMDATEYYVRHRSPVFAELEGRITILGDSSRSSVTKSLSLSLVIILSVATMISL